MEYLSIYIEKDQCIFKLIYCRSRVQTDDKPKSYITKKILRKIEESSEKREKETQRGD